MRWPMPDSNFHLLTRLLYCSTWDNPGTGLENERNATGYEDLTQVELAAAHGLGFDKFYWDCLIQHYNSYKWNELPGQGKEWVTLARTLYWVAKDANHQFTV